jgi:cyanophycinase-like exopeptidase
MKINPGNRNMPDKEISLHLPAQFTTCNPMKKKPFFHSLLQCFLTLLICSSFGIANLFGQSYTSYFTGDTTNVSPVPVMGMVLAGGATDNDNAMTWFLEHANGGDVLVIRASGSDGYNDYLYSQLGVNVNSVETILWNNAAASNDPYVLQQIENAEAIFIAGGNQLNYVNFWRNTAVEDLLNAHLNVKHAVIGGTSAGMAILGGHYFSAGNGSVLSNEALSNPYGASVTIGQQDFLDMPFLHDVITDTHYDNPDRRGRQMAFMARIYQDGNPMALGIASTEYVAVCIGENGIATAFGEWPQYDEYAYFIRHGCQAILTPEICSANTPLTWNRNENATYVYRMKATISGSGSFDLNDWMSADGGDWQEWWVENGTINFNEVSSGPGCPLQTVTGVSEIYQAPGFSISNINSTSFLIRSTDSNKKGILVVYNSAGQIVIKKPINRTDQIIQHQLATGIYVVRLNGSVQRLLVAAE